MASRFAIAADGGSAVVGVVKVVPRRWSKSIVQAEFARYVVTSGDTYLRALNRLPGRLPSPGQPVSWTLWFSLLSFVPGVIGMGGILGATGQALVLLAPDIDSRWMTLLAALAASTILYTGSYRRLERTMLILVGGFTVSTIVAVIAMQTTDFRVRPDDIAAGFVRMRPPRTGCWRSPSTARPVSIPQRFDLHVLVCGEGLRGPVGARRDDPGWLTCARLGPAAATRRLDHARDPHLRDAAVLSARRGCLHEA
jgi:hypothetical protein